MRIRSVMEYGKYRVELDDEHKPQAGDDDELFDVENQGGIFTMAECMNNNGLLLKT